MLRGTKLSGLSSALIGLYHPVLLHQTLAHFLSDLPVCPHSRRRLTGPEIDAAYTATY